MSENKDLKKEYELKMYSTQSPDCCSLDDDFQELKLEHHDGGGGSFYTISTDRWAFENPDELMSLIYEFIGNFKKLNNENN